MAVRLLGPFCLVIVFAVFRSCDCYVHSGDQLHSQTNALEEAHPNDKRSGVSLFDYISEALKKVDKLEEKIQELSAKKKPKECPDGWWKYGRSCYLFFGYRASWFDALTICPAFGGYLAEINSDSENTYLWKNVRYHKDHFWIGGTDLIKENHWIWATSKTRMTTSVFSNWARGQPDGNSNEHCMDMRYGYSGWNDNQCHIAQRFICEMDLK